MKLGVLPYALAVITVVGGSVAGSVVDRGEQRRVSQQQRAQARTVLQMQARSLDDAMRERLGVVAELRAFVLTHPAFTDDEFQTFARTLAVRQPRAIQGLYLAEGSRVSNAYPMETNRRAIGMDLLTAFNRRDTVLGAMTSERVVITGPIALGPGEQVVAGLLPVWAATAPMEETYWGLAIIVMPLEEALGRTGTRATPDGYRLAVRISGGSPGPSSVLAGNPAIFAAAPETVDLPLSGDTWQLAAIPQRGWSSVTRAMWWMRLGSGLLIGLAATLVFVLTRYPLRLRASVTHATIALAEREEQLRQAHADLERRVQERTVQLADAVRDLHAENAERARAEDRYRALFDDAPVMYAIIRPQRDTFVIDDCNKLFASSLGYTREQALGRPATAFLTEAGAQEVAAWGGIERAFRETVDSEYVTLQTRTGAAIRALVHARHESAADGDLTGLRITFVDVSARTQMEVALRQSEERLTRIVETMAEGIVMLDAEGRRTLANAAADRMFGLPRNALLGHGLDAMPFQRFTLDGEPLPDAAHPFTMVKATDAAVSQIEYVIDNGCGTRSVVSVNAAPLHDSDGGFTGIVASVTDVTQRRLAEGRRAVQLAVTRVLAESTTLEVATERLVETLCTGLRWDTGELWRVDSSRGCLRRAAIWSAPDVDAHTFDNAGREFVIRPGESLPGQVWESAAPCWVRDVASSQTFVRAAAAARAGLRGACAVPLRAGNDVTGVLMLLSRADHAPDTDLLGILTEIGDQIGQFIARKLTESALHETQDRFCALVQHAADMIVVLDRDGSASYISPSVERTLGYPLAGLHQKRINDFIHPDDRDGCVRAMAAVMRTPGSHPLLTFRMRHADGGWRWFETRANNLLHDPAVRGVVHNAQDITERRLAEHALSESEERFRGLFQNALMGIYRADQDGRLLLANPAMVQMLGYDSLDNLLARGDGDTTAIPPSFWVSPDHDTHVSGREMAWERPDGALVVMRQNIRAVHDAAGSLRFYEGTVEDVTEQHKLTARLVQAEQLSALGELAAGMAHEVNNPLAVVAATAELALRGDATPALRGDLAMIHREAVRAGEIVRSLLRFARHREPAPEPISMQDVVDEAITLQHERLTRHAVTVGVRAEPAPSILADRDQLLQIFLNLLRNSVDAVKECEQRQITIAIAAVGDEVEATVQDSGPGIPVELLGRIFNPFVTTKAPGEGTGLGLSISRRIAADHGGSLTAENGPEGGARFRLALPAASPPESATAAEDVGRVLILHPDAMAAGILAEAVRLAGYAATVCDADTRGFGDGWVAAIVSPDTSPAALAAVRSQDRHGRLIAAGAPRDGQDFWDAALPARYRLSDITLALAGA